MLGGVPGAMASRLVQTGFTGFRVSEHMLELYGVLQYCPGVLDEGSSAKPDKGSESKCPMTVSFRYLGLARKTRPNSLNPCLSPKLG